jgi:hypothetical protein
MTDGGELVSTLTKAARGPSRDRGSIPRTSTSAYAKACAMVGSDERDRQERERAEMSKTSKVKVTKVSLAEMAARWAESVEQGRKSWIGGQVSVTEATACVAA